MIIDGVRLKLFQFSQKSYLSTGPREDMTIYKVCSELWAVN